MIGLHILKQRQSLPLEAKINMSIHKIREFHDKLEGMTYVAFSGGKDSTVLLHLVRSLYPDTPAVFSNTGLEYPEIVEFVKTIPNVEMVRPKVTFKDVIENHGYPVISKVVSKYVREMRTPNKESNQKTRTLRMTGFNSKGKFSPSMRLAPKWHHLIDAPFKISDKCCHYIKKSPIEAYAKATKRRPYIGMMASDSKARERTYLEQGCNAFDIKYPQSNPLGFWLEKDVWEYIKLKKIPYSKIYDMGYERTGCMFCMFGIMRDKKPNRFQRMSESHPKLWSYCIKTLGLGPILTYLKVPYVIEKELF